MVRGSGRCGARAGCRDGARLGWPGTIRPIRPAQFVANMMGLLIFPFAIRPALCLLLGLDEGAWRSFLTERRRFLPGFFMAGLRP